MTSSIVALRLHLRGLAETALAAVLGCLATTILILLVVGQIPGGLRAQWVVLASVGTAMVAIAVAQPSRIAEDWWAQTRRFRPVKVRAWIRAVRTHPWASILAGLVALELGWNVVAAVVLPPYAGDALAYHLPPAAYWVQQAHIALTPYLPPSNVYPLDAELFFTWPMVLLHNDFLVGLGQLVFAIGGVLAVVVTARAVGISRSGSVVAGSLFFLTPVILAQVNTNYVDVAVACSFLMAFAFAFRALQTLDVIRVVEPTISRVDSRQELRARKRLAGRYLALAGLSAGLAAGVKGTGLADAAVLALLIAAGLAYAAKLHVVHIRTAGLLFGLFIVMLPLLGSFWYARNLIDFGNPIEPFSLRLAGIELIHGTGQAVEDTVILPGTRLYVVDNEPPQLRGKSALASIAISWTHEPQTAYTPEGRLGGLGTLWIYCELPLLLLAAIWCARHRRDLLFALVAPFMLVFLIEPANWWARFTIVVIAPGVLALLAIIEHVGSRKRWTARALQLFVLLLAATTVVTATKKNGLKSYSPISVARLATRSPTQRTFGNLFDPEFRWVDTIPHNSTIAVRQADVPLDLLYPLFGRDLSHRVVILRSSALGSLKTTVVQSRVDYVLTAKDGTLDREASTDPTDFGLVATTAASRIYRVIRR